ncbi:MAG: adenosylcobinamide-GDP ribazoletransferase [Cyanobacteria bacterium J06635_1]
MLKKYWAALNAGILFYTVLPLPGGWPTAFERAAKAVVWVGLLIGGLLAGTDFLLGFVLPLTVRSVVVVLAGLALTGGLHMDGAMDTADGLAVTDPERRLEVMADSRTGAFGVMAAIAIVLLKLTALIALPDHRWFALIGAAGWGRWGQQWAIARYPYAKKTGKGAFHKQALPSRWHTLSGWLPLVAVSLGAGGLGWVPMTLAIAAMGLGSVSAIATAAWFAHKLGGHTGDTYGAVVEWGEALFLVGLVGVSALR